MKKISLLFLWTLSMSCTTQRMKLAFDGDLDPEKFGDGLNSHEVALAQAIYQNDAQQAAAIAHSASKSIDINKYINAQRWNKPGQLPFLLFATFQDRPAIVELILDNTWGESNMQGIAFINQQSRGSERTALHMAAERGYRAVVDILLAAGAAVDAATTKGETPLHLALDSTYVAIAKKLLAAGAAIEATTSEGKTPLHLAAEKNLVAIAKELVAKNAAVDATTSEGKTPLHLAAENNGQEAVSYLLSNQANPQATDHQERTPLALACSAHHEEIVKILERHEKKSYRRSCMERTAECDEHCTACLACGGCGFMLNCACFQKPCGFACKTLCCIWCYPLKEEAPHPASSGSATTAPLLGSPPMQR